MEVTVTFFEVLLGLVPVVAFAAPLIAFLVDQAKRAGLPDGFAPLVSGVLNLVFFALLFFLPNEAERIEDYTGAVYAFAPYVVALLVALISSSWVHDRLTAVGIGYSHTDAEADAVMG